MIYFKTSWDCHCRDVTVLNYSWIQKCTEWWFLWEDKQPDACTNKLYCVWLNLKHPTHHIHLCNALWLSYESISHGALNIPVEENLWYACYTFFFFVGLTGFDSISSCLGLLRDHRPLSTSKQISLIGQYDFKGWLFYLLLVVRISIFSCLTVKSMHIAPGNLSLPLPPPPQPTVSRKSEKGYNITVQCKAWLSTPTWSTGDLFVWWKDIPVFLSRGWCVRSFYCSAVKCTEVGKKL